MDDARCGGSGAPPPPFAPSSQPAPPLAVRHLSTSTALNDPQEGRSPRPHLHEAIVVSFREGPLGIELEPVRTTGVGEGGKGGEQVGCRIVQFLPQSQALERDSDSGSGGDSDSGGDRDSDSDSDSGVKGKGKGKGKVRTTPPGSSLGTSSGGFPSFPFAVVVVVAAAQAVGGSPPP